MRTLVVIERGELWRVEEWSDRPLARCMGYQGSQEAMLHLAADCIASLTRAGIAVQSEVVILPRTAAEWYGAGDSFRSTPATELTPIGEQLVIPGCERRETARGRRPTQRSLWGDPE